MIKQYNKQYKKGSKNNFKLYTNKNAYRFHWDIITHCNYKCSYCYSRANDIQWSKMTNKETIDKVFEKFNEIPSEIEVILLGGEPTISPYYFDIVNRLYQLKNLNIFGIITNGSKLTNSFIDKHLNFKDKINFNLSCHFSELENHNDVSNFLESAYYIKKNGFMININIILDQNYSDLIVDIIKKLDMYDIPIMFNIPFDKDDPTLKTSPDLKWLEYINSIAETPTELIFSDDQSEKSFNDIDVYLDNLNDFTDWYCNNRNFEIPVKTSSFIRMCEQKEYTINELLKIKDIKCPLKNCLCQGLLSNEKYRIMGK